MGKLNPMKEQTNNSGTIDKNLDHDPLSLSIAIFIFLEFFF